MYIYIYIFAWRTGSESTDAARRLRVYLLTETKEAPLSSLSDKTHMNKFYHLYIYID